MRFAQCNYDKPHRCPGWSGSGWTLNKRNRCIGGTTWLGDPYSRFWYLKVRRTACCGTYVLPHALVWLNWRTYVIHGTYWYPWQRVKWMPRRRLRHHMGRK